MEHAFERSAVAGAQQLRMESHDLEEHITVCLLYTSPYFRPGSDSVRDYRLRRDNPEMEYRHGELKPRGKYLSPPDRPPMLYFVPGTPLERYHDTTLPIIITEGEKKSLALETLAWHGMGDAADRPRWIPIAFAGVWSWRGKTGRTPGTHGGFDKTVGPIRDFELIAWQGRQVTIVFEMCIRDSP